MKPQDLIVFEDDDLVALNKPSGLLSIPDRAGKDPSLKELLQQVYPAVFTIHRLDRETSGLILFAKNAEAHKHFSQQFEGRKTVKIYNGLVMGSVPELSGSIDAPIAENMVKRGTMLIHRRGKQALTDFNVLKDFKIYSWMEFRIHTGRTHQIRIHAKEIGHPLAVDTIYGDGKPLYLSSFKPKFNLSKEHLEERPLLNRLALHASRLKIEAPEGHWLELEAPLHKDLKATLQQLEKMKK
ncbi:RluA family pseudouridine synthase [Niabella drilacis]|uniref:Pseudouridine synthase n=1 Tax=Niabella drilacis (strain DSM 25811 / CCM 8410 / CCUG 62505 / LMG 26954 / E90) TaxID=1285928 RepID=A0A1G6PHM8_NIADE|nr:RluA family pseudouridine synthase [Niabella drilacis]SDC79558.1 23S rRNA pseudouridine955/2504/2580 synthase [Niabella drilacis]